MGAPLGNQNARKGKFSEAVELAGQIEDPVTRKRRITAIAEKLSEKAMNGDIAAIKEFADRHDGRAPQSLTLGNDPENPLQTQVVVNFPGMPPATGS